MVVYVRPLTTLFEGASFGSTHHTTNAALIVGLSIDFPLRGIPFIVRRPAALPSKVCGNSTL